MHYYFFDKLLAKKRIIRNEISLYNDTITIRTRRDTMTRYVLNDKRVIRSKHKLSYLNIVTYLRVLKLYHTLTTN